MYGQIKIRIYKLKKITNPGQQGKTRGNVGYKPPGLLNKDSYFLFMYLSIVRRTRNNPQESVTIVDTEL